MSDALAAGVLMGAVEYNAVDEAHKWLMRQWSRSTYDLRAVKAASVAQNHQQPNWERMQQFATDGFQQNGQFWDQVVQNVRTAMISPAEKLWELASPSSLQENKKSDLVRLASESRFSRPAEDRTRTTIKLPEKPPTTTMREATEMFQRTGEFPEVTPRYMRCTKEGPEEVQRRWEDTLRWRADNRVNELVESTPQRYHGVIKKHYPHYFYMKSKNNCQVAYEHIGRTDMKALRKSGLSFEELLNYYTFESEFLYTYLEPEDNAQTITVLDCSGFSATSIPSDVVKFVRANISIMTKHYPERAFRVYIINAPVTFSFMWRAISSVLDPSTLDKVHVSHTKEAALEALQEFIHIDDIPEMYGGNCKVPLHESPEELALKALVTRLNESAREEDSVE
mmetsp:Transcript_19962/g.39205  ORF Transcript_19962/g.39205 Transcript_19962/m.39205 type:complete len:395 (-) Transcript_19962:140-1324(-)